MDDVMADPVVADYLRRLDDAARVLPDNRRRELVDEIAAHIAEAQAGTPGEPSVAAVRTLLDRLGEPEEIVAAARAEEWAESGYSTGDSAVRVLRAPSIWLEVIAVLLMTVGSIVPVALWLIGVVLMWSSKRWRTWEKAVATVLFPGGPFFVLVLATFLPTRIATCTSSGAEVGGGVGSSQPVIEHCTSTGRSFPGWIGVPLALLWFAVPIAIAIALVVRARARAATEPPVEVWRSGSGGAHWGPLEVAAVLLLSLGAFVFPVVGPLAGLACAWLSSAWTRTEKWIATAITLVPVAIGILLLLLVLAI